MARLASSSPASFAPPIDAPFTIDGRFSARRGSDAVAPGFSWSHAAPRDDIVLTSPLGQTVAELEGDASVPRTELRSADGRRDTAADWASLTARVFGLPLPVEALAWWTQGAPRADAPHSVELDALGRAEFVRILTEPKNALVLQYTALLKTDGVDIVFSKEAVDEIARLAEEVNTRTENIGARRLHTLMERLLEEVLFDAPDLPAQRVVVDPRFVETRLKDIISSEDLSRFIL